MTKVDEYRRLYVKPATGRVVKMPERAMAIMPEEGANVPRNTYWARRIECGDVVLANDTSISELSVKGVKTK